MTNRGSNESIWERLDRAICSKDWRLLFAEGFLRHLPRVASDHCPILLSLHSNHIPRSHLKPFRFEAMWLKHVNFDQTVKQFWETQPVSFVDKTQGLANVLLNWNRTSFGCIFHRKRRILARLQGIQTCLGDRFKPSLSKLEAKLQEEYNQIIDQEEIFWRQKSRTTWLKEGDKNTKFFHLTTMIRRRYNKLEGLKDEDGIWRCEKEDMQAIALSYFTKLFSGQPPQDSYDRLPRFFPVLEGDLNEELNRVVCDEEVKLGLFGIGKLKSPGPDGFPAVFFQSQWEVCRKDLCQLVRDSFEFGYFPALLNQTIIALIPKVPSPLDMTQLRPISLCNTAYKVISKVIVQRLRGLLPKVVSPNQVAFIPGRQIQDNIVVAQEVLHKFKIMKGKKGFVAWKIDFAKAYDKLQWSFICNVLKDVGIGGSLLKLIMWCISSVSFKIAMNGEVTDSFNPGCGIRQGDPLSPHIFVLCMEKLSHLINQKLRVGLWKSVKISRGGPEVSHLFFADDLILFGQASITQAETMRECLDTFCEFSGQQVSFPKSRVFCSNNIREGAARAIARVCGSPITHDLGNYLGVPLIHSRVTNQTYRDLVEKTQRRLAAWKSETLSMAGRTTLIKAVTSALPIYTMQSVKLPSEICLKLDKINRDFLWGHTTTKNAIHLVKWENVCLPRRNGGLGIKKTKSMNQALLAKIGWRILRNDDGIWCRLLQHKYLNNKTILDPELAKGIVCSSIWKGIAFGAKLIVKGVKWRIGDGSQVRFWLDDWVPGVGILMDYATKRLSEEELAQTVNGFMTNGCWNVQHLAGLLPWDVVHKVVNIHAGREHSGQDRVIWGWSKCGNFSVKSAYSGQFEDDSLPLWKWRFIWRQKLPPKIQFFLWILLQDKALTNLQRMTRGLASDPTCPRCSAEVEDIDHLVRGCSHSRYVWKNISGICSESAFFQGQLDDWFAENLGNDKMISGKIPSYLLFSCTVWFLWKWRCKMVFDHSFSSPHLPHLIINQYAKEWLSANTGESAKTSYLFSVSWEPPSEGWIKLNIDGSCDSVSGHIAVGGIMRNHCKYWMKGFVASKGVGTVIEAELWGLFEGLTVAWNDGIRRLIAETDSLETVQLITNDTNPNHPLFSLIQSCKHIVNADWSCRVQHVYREGNRLADGLAHMGHSMKNEFLFFEDPPPEVADVYFDDCRGLAVVRQSSAPVVSVS
ncbi:hypothetical protein Q3G72_031946 [Acer saccharum]|nr:hypothetical protein Q3G72_031946 [Acer saccharum]